MNSHLIASSVRNIPTENYQNLIIGFHVTIENVGAVFLRHSVVDRLFTTLSIWWDIEAIDNTGLLLSTRDTENSNAIGETGRLSIWQTEATGPLHLRLNLQSTLNDQLANQKIAKRARRISRRETTDNEAT